MDGDSQQHYILLTKVCSVTCSKCFSPSSSSVSCGTAVGLPIGAIIFEGKGKGLFIATGTSMDFCCGSWMLGDGTDTSAFKRTRTCQTLEQFHGRQSKSRRCFSMSTGKLKSQISPVRVVEMWVMGRDSSMLLVMGTCRGTLQDSGGSSRGGCRSAGLSGSSGLLGWLGGNDCTGT